MAASRSMVSSRRLVLLVALCGCGRSGLDDFVAAPADAGASRDAGAVVDAGTRDAGTRVDAGVRAGPSFVFKRSNACPGTGSEPDLVPGPGERLVLLKTTVQTECSGAGGDWLIGTQLDGTSIAFGAHACFFVPNQLHNTAWFALARIDPNGPLLMTETGWCILPVTTNVKVLAWGLYPSELDATAARAALTP
jgi:hypothetical protein